MQRVSLHHKVFLLLLLAVLALPLKAAASPLGFLDHFWAFVKSAWSESDLRLVPDGAPAPQPGSGCHIDPDGSAQPEEDTGSRLDPNG